MKKNKWGFHWALLCAVLVGLTNYLFFGTVKFYSRRFEFMRDSDFAVLINIFPMLLLSPVFLYLTTRIKSFSWYSSIEFLGFKLLNSRQVYAAAITLVPVFLFNFIGYERNVGLGTEYHVRSNWFVFLIFILVSCVYEEAIVRGFVFQLLRSERPFFWAAFLSGILWAIMHLGILSVAADDSKYMVRQLMGTMLVCVLLAFPSAYVFERGGNIIWGWILVHVGVDSIFLIGSQDGHGFRPGLSSDFRWIGMIIMTIVTFPIVDLFLSKGKNRKG